VERKVNKISEGLRKKGYSVAGWARARGLNPHTVYQFIYKKGGYKGIYGDIAKKIQTLLEKEGVV
jgi:gp16 family phage-associated protein